LLHSTCAAAATAAASPTATTATTTATAAAFDATPSTTAWAAFLFLVHGNLDRNTTFEHDLNRVPGDIDRNNFAITAGGLQHRSDLWHLLFGLDIVIIFIRETTHQTTTDAGDFRGIEGKPLLLRHFNRDNAKVGNPRTATERFPARPDTTLQLRLIPGPYLA